MTMGPHPPTPEALHKFARWQAAFMAAIERLKARADWNTCTCQQCVEGRHIAIQQEMPEEFRT